MDSFKDRSRNWEVEKAIQAWTSAEWHAFLSEVEAEILALKETVLSLPRKIGRLNP